MHESLSEHFEAIVSALQPGDLQVAWDGYTAALEAAVKAERARRANAPRMALRPHNLVDWPGLDDVVVERPTMFRAEFMHENDLWLCCYFPEPHDRITFHINWDKHRKQLEMHDGEMPAEWVDIDKEKASV